MSNISFNSLTNFNPNFNLIEDKNGWVKTDEVKNTNIIQTSMIVDDEMIRRDSNYENNIVKALLDNLTSELLKNKNIQVHKQKIPNYKNETEFKLVLNVADIKYDKIIVQKNSFYWKDKEFSEYELIEALENMYPEYTI